MGRKQRHSDLIGLTDEEVERAAKDRSLDSRTRRKFQQEAIIEVALSGTQLSRFDPTDQALAEAVERWPELNGKPLASDDLVQELVEAFEARGKPLPLRLPG
jgi:hypothetical protein